MRKVTTSLASLTASVAVLSTPLTQAATSNDSHLLARGR